MGKLSARQTRTRLIFKALRFAPLTPIQPSCDGFLRFAAPKTSCSYRFHTRSTCKAPSPPLRCIQRYAQAAGRRRPTTTAGNSILPDQRHGKPTAKPCPLHARLASNAVCIFAFYFSPKFLMRFPLPFPNLLFCRLQDLPQTRRIRQQNALQLFLILYC